MGEKGCCLQWRGWRLEAGEKWGVAACLGSAGRAKVPSRSAAALNKKAVGDGDWCQGGAVVKMPDGFPKKRAQQFVGTTRCNVK